jgi:hypothetical protein
LADTCANASFIQKDLAVELGLTIDESKKYDVAGAGPSRTFGMVKGVIIELTPDCVITEDLTVLSEYKHREIGLSRACLKRYNYDVHESREHIVLICDGKNVFIPIVPDVNRGVQKIGSLFFFTSVVRQTREPDGGRLALYFLLAPK